MHGKQKPGAYEPKNMRDNKTHQPMPIPAVGSLKIKKGNERGSGAATTHSKAKSTAIPSKGAKSSAWSKRPNKDPKSYNGPKYD